MRKVCEFKRLIFFTISCFTLHFFLFGMPHGHLMHLIIWKKPCPKHAFLLRSLEYVFLNEQKMEKYPKFNHLFAALKQMKYVCLSFIFCLFHVWFSENCVYSIEKRFLKYICKYNLIQHKLFNVHWFPMRFNMQLINMFLNW